MKMGSQNAKGVLDAALRSRERPKGQKHEERVFLITKSLVRASRRRRPTLAFAAQQAHEVRVASTFPSGYHEKAQKECT